MKIKPIILGMLCFAPCLVRAGVEVITLPTQVMDPIMEATAGGPYYGSPGSVTIAVGDRPYYSRGPGYWYGGAYYVWRPGHWANRYGQQVWIHGHYVVRGY